MSIVCPIGEREVVVTRAAVQQVPWRRFADNPDGDALTLVLDAGAEVFPIRCDVALSNTQLLDVVAGAFGTDRFNLVPEDLIGRHTRIVVRHYERASGIVAIVGRWVDYARRSVDPMPYSRPRFPTTGSSSEAKRPRKGKPWSRGQGDVMW